MKKIFALMFAVAVMVACDKKDNSSTTTDKDSIFPNDSDLAKEVTTKLNAWDETQRNVTFESIEVSAKDDSLYVGENPEL
jgi:uncharacterized protein YcfL